MPRLRLGTRLPVRLRRSAPLTVQMMFRSDTEYNFDEDTQGQMAGKGHADFEYNGGYAPPRGAVAVFIRRLMKLQREARTAAALKADPGCMDVTLVGHSMGAMDALLSAQIIPPLLRAHVHLKAFKVGNDVLPPTLPQKHGDFLAVPDSGNHLIPYWTKPFWTPQLPPYPKP